MQHKEFVSIPNLPVNPKRMLENIEWVQKKYEKSLSLSFSVCRDEQN